MAKEPVERVIERAYFHVGNGGLTLSIVELQPGGGGTPNEFRFKHAISVFGQSSESSFPLGSSDIVSWMNMALQRVSMKVAATAHDGRSFIPFDNPPDVTHVNGEEVAKTASLFRIVARYQSQLAKEFSSPEALREYLHEHPQADKSLHTVKKPGEDKKPEGKPDDKAKPKTTWKDVVKSLSAKAVSFVKKAPEQVKKFIENDDFRYDTIYKARKALEEAPAKFMQSAWDQAKHEAKEFKEAHDGIKAWMGGAPMTKEQKSALKKVATHVAIATVAGVLGAGLGAGAVALGKGVAGSFLSSTAKKIAVKAVTKRLEHLPAFEELHHITEHGSELVHHFIEKLAAEDKKPSEEEILKSLILASVMKEMENLSAEELAEAIEEASGVED